MMNAEDKDKMVSILKSYTEPTPDSNCIVYTGENAGKLQLHGEQLVAEYVGRPESFRDIDKIYDERLLKEMKEYAKHYKVKVLEKTFTSDKVRLTLQKFNLPMHYIDQIIIALETE